MKYYFLNTYSIDNLDPSIDDKIVIDSIGNIAYFIKELNKLDIELILGTQLTNLNLRGNKIHHFFKIILADENLDSDSVKLLLSRIQKQTPFCSDKYDKYFENESIVLGDCKVEDTDICILENFLACSLFLDSPVITIKDLCNTDAFLNSKIVINCNCSTKELLNYFLEEKEEILKEIQEEIKKSITTWVTWEQTILPTFGNIQITDDCLKEIKIYSFNSIIARSILTFIEVINDFVIGNQVGNLNYSDCYSNTSKESDTRLRDFKAQLASKDYNNERITANWHTYINEDFRLYFTTNKEDNKICFVKFTKKIS